jgi:hypothetical protein
MAGGRLVTEQPRKRGPYKAKPHPKDAEMRELLAKGLSNRAVVELLDVPPRQVARVRASMKLGPTPRSAWRTPRHPKDTEIRELLADGHTDAEISRRTGADVETIARRRREARLGPATIRVAPPRPPHPKTDEIQALLRHYSNTEIGLRLGVDKHLVAEIRAAAGVLYLPGLYATAEQKWLAHVRPVDGGHLEWTGSRSGRSDTPVMKFHEKSAAPSGIAFRWAHGREPVGQVRPECDFPHCQAPAHVEDEPGRQQLREQLRAIRGMGPRPETCPGGHDQATEGRLQRDGEAYCKACKREGRRKTT